MILRRFFVGFVMIAACGIVAPCIAQESAGLAVIGIEMQRSDAGPRMRITDFVVIQTSKIVHDPHVKKDEAVYALIPATEQSVPLDTILIDDPFNPRFEYPEDDDAIGTVRIPQDISHILIRIPYSDAMRILQLARVTGQRTYEVLESIPLPQPVIKE